MCPKDCNNLSSKCRLFPKKTWLHFLNKNIRFSLNSKCALIFYDRPPEEGKHPVVRVGTILLAMLGLYPQYTAIVTVLMLAGVIQVDKPSLR